LRINSLTNKKHMLLFSHLAKYKIMNAVKIFKALGDENRLKAIVALSYGELCACQLVELLDLADSTVSRHLAILKEAGLIKDRKRGRWVYFRINDDIDSVCRSDEFRMILKLAKKDRILSNSDKQIRKITKTDPELICLKRRN